MQTITDDTELKRELDNGNNGNVKMATQEEDGQQQKEMEGHKRKLSGGNNDNGMNERNKKAKHQHKEGHQQEKEKEKEPKAKFVRRRAVFGKRGTQKRVELPSLREFASLVEHVHRQHVIAQEAMNEMVDTSTIDGDLADMSEAYAVFCTLVRSGEWEDVDVQYATLHCMSNTNTDEERHKVLFFACGVCFVLCVHLYTS